MDIIADKEIINARYQKKLNANKAKILQQKAATKVTKIQKNIK